jgi:hypothetical protein
MPTVDFDSIPGETSVVPGTYEATIEDVRVKATKNGDEMWSVRLLLTGATGRGYVWDNWVFSAKAIHRTRIICRAFGLPTSGQVTLIPDEMIGRACTVNVEAQDYEDADGNTRSRAVIPFDGYLEPEGTSPATEEDL